MANKKIAEIRGYLAIPDQWKPEKPVEIKTRKNGVNPDEDTFTINEFVKNHLSECEGKRVKITIEVI